jgi:solute carrier family 39 (zinc transporter), member 9
VDSAVHRQTPSARTGKGGPKRNAGIAHFVEPKRGHGICVGVPRSCGSLLSDLVQRSFLAGIVPLSFSLGPSRMRYISAVGAGVLVGTSLAVVIPEGVETLYGAALSSNRPGRRELHIVSSAESDPNVEDAHGKEVFYAADMSGSSPSDLQGAHVSPLELRGVRSLSERVEAEGNAASDSEHHRHPESPHAWTGVALLSGFIFMYLIDMVPRSISSTKPTDQPHHIALNDLARGLEQSSLPSHHTEVQGQWPEGSSATTTGLVIHAAADGIALGASSSSADIGLNFIIFFAIMVHKAPAAFGLTSILLKTGMSRRIARAHLLCFSAAAPTGAILTYLVVYTLGAGKAGDSQSTKWWTGMLLLFSGGTFLYVAVHAMQDAGTSPQALLDEHFQEVSEGRDIERQHPKLTSSKELIASVVGMILPLVIQIGHAH